MNTYNLTSLHNDKCDKTYEEKNYDKMFEYTMNGYKDLKNKNTKFINETGVFLGQTQHVDNKRINKESDIKNGVLGNQITGEKSKVSKLLHNANNVGNPYLGNGKSIIVDPKIHSKRIGGILTRDNKFCTKCNKSCRIPNNICTNRGSMESTWWNQPNVKNAKKIQDINNIIPRWQNGGINTRDYIRNIDSNKK
jgi:hypothetical protein